MEKQFIYSLDERPPVHHLFMLSMQHVMLMFMSLSLPIIFSAQINATVEFTAALVTFSMLASGIGSIMQAARLPFMGSGYLCPNVCGPSYFSLSLSAMWTGGMPLFRGMTIIAGLVEVVMAPLVHKLKYIFPNYIVGLVVAMVGVSVINPAITSLFGLNYRGDGIITGDAILGFVALAVMVLCNVWGKGNIKMYCLLIGMCAGWIIAVILFPEARQSFTVLRARSILAVPRMDWSFHQIAFDAKMFIPFVVIGISGSLKSFGNLLAAQQISQPELKKPDFKPLRNGLMADGLSTVLAGVFGAIAVDTSSSNVGLAASTRVVSRWLSVVAGIIFIAFSFSPLLTTFFSLMPKSVLGSSIIFAACFMIITGLQQMFQDTWDTRKTFVIGIALILGLSTSFLPTLYARAPRAFQTFFTDPLPTTTIIAVFLHQIINIDRTFVKFGEYIKKAGVCSLRQRSL